MLFSVSGLIRVSHLLKCFVGGAKLIVDRLAYASSCPQAEARRLGREGAVGRQNDRDSPAGVPWHEGRLPLPQQL